MRDLVLTAAILCCTLVAAHAGAMQIGSLFNVVNSSFEHVLAHVG